MPKYKATAYIRLSYTDDHSSESDSVSNPVSYTHLVYVGSMYLTEIRPLQELGTNFANVLNAVTKTKEILDIPIYEGGTRCV